MLEIQRFTCFVLFTEKSHTYYCVCVCSCNIDYLFAGISIPICYDIVDLDIVVMILLSVNTCSLLTLAAKG